MMRLSLVVICASVLLPAIARADRREAGERYKKGVGLYKEGDYGAALSEFRAAYNASPTFEVLYNIGLSERRLFKYGQAVKTLNRYLEEGGKKVPKDRRESVEKELEQISGLTAVVSVKVVGAPARVSIDGEVLGSSPLSEVVLLGPGKHTFKAERPGFVADEKVLEVVSRTKVEVELSPHSKEELAPAEVNLDSLPSGAVLTVDGKLAGLAPTKVQLSPGGHEVIAELDGYPATRSEVVVAAGQSRTVVINLERAEAAASARRVKVPLVGVLVGVGGLGLLAGGIALNVQAGAEAKKTSALFASGGTWDAQAAAVQSAGLSAQTWSWVLTLAGSAAFATGLVLSLMTMFGRGGEEESALWLAPTPGGVTVGWSFAR